MVIIFHKKREIQQIVYIGRFHRHVGQFHRYDTEGKTERFNLEA